LMNTQEYLLMRHEALNNDGITTPAATDYDVNGLWDTTRYTDWQKTLIGGTAHYTNLTVTISGGNSTTQYLLGSTYHRETTVFPGNFADQKGSVHFNLNNTSSDQKFRLQFSASYMVDNNELPNIDLTNLAMTLAPDAPPAYKADGSLNWVPDSSGNSSFYSNPLAQLYNTYSNKTNNLISNAIASYQIMPGLNIKSSFGYTNLQSNEITTYPLIAIQPELQANSPRVAGYSDNNINSWIIEPQIDYKKALGKGDIEGLIASTIEQSNSKGQQLGGTGYNSDLVLDDIGSAANVFVLSTYVATYKYNALFGHLNYKWDDKYLLSLNARRDGSSRFGSANQFHDFGSVGIGWIFSKEPFVQNALPFVSFGKFKASYGTTGNDQIGDYKFLSLYVPNNVGFPYQGATGLAVNGISNPYLQWEETKKEQFGFDVGLLRDRILFSAIYSHNRSSNELLSYGLPIITGVPSITENFPATVQNTSWELTLNTTNIKGKNFSWSSRINLTVPRNKLVAFPNLATSSYAGTYFVGQPITLLEAYHYLGVDPQTGQYEVADSHGTPTTTPNYTTDRTVMINTSPKLYAGFNNSFRFKGIELNIFFQFVNQKGPNFNYGTAVPGYFNTNQPVSVLNRWQKPGDIKPIQLYNSTGSLSSVFGNVSGAASDAGYSNASFARLKNLSLSWQLPEKWTKKAHLQYCRLYLQGQNLLTFTKYSGLDPETLSSSTLPPLRVMTAGIQITL
jgi:TonB-linked SusC/RagA family outer membrane protein